MSSLPFRCNGFGCRRVNRVPVLFVADDRTVWENGPGRSLFSTTLHEFSKILPRSLGQIHQLPHDIGIVNRHVCGLGLVDMQVIKNGTLKASKGFVLIPKRQLLFASRQMSFQWP